MRVSLTYKDSDSVSPQEILLNAERLYGDSVSVELLPEGKTPRDFIRFAIALEVTGKQLSAFFDNETLIYEEKIEVIKEQFLEEVKELLDETIASNRRLWTS